MKIGVEWALEAVLKQEQMVLGILRVCWMVLLYFPPTSLVFFLVRSNTVLLQRGLLCGQAEWGKCPPGKCCCRIPPSRYKHSMNPHVWACCQFIFLRSKIRTAPLGEKTWERGVLTTHENIWNTFKNSSLKATGSLKTEYPTVGSLEN